ncbi:uncharacterized protein LOC142483061 [Ascaphus truei]|uniref:uncharacterized protein LOC142483061 n=1 Tax=Ascaphus truei TaxID=8439 RepID=UPI003F592AF2
MELPGGSPFAGYPESVSDGEQSSEGGRGGAGRRKREFISDEKKDASYWEKRRKNNEAAKRSREKRRFHDLVLEGRVAALDEENGHLRRELLQLKLRFGLVSAASFLEAGQGLGVGEGGETGPLLCGGPGGYASSYLGLNSDSSEAEQSGRDSGGGAALDRYSPSGSLSEMSDQSSSDSPGSGTSGEGRGADGDYAHLRPVEGGGTMRLSPPRGGVILYRVGGHTVDPRQWCSQDAGVPGEGAEGLTPPLRSSIFEYGRAECLQTPFQHLMKTVEAGALRGPMSPTSPPSGYQSEDSGNEEGGPGCCPPHQDAAPGVKLPHKLRLKSRANGQEAWGGEREPSPCRHHRNGVSLAEGV